MTQLGEAELQRLWRLSEAQVDSKNWREAAASFDAILTAVPDHLPSLLRSPLVLLQLDRYRDARSRVLDGLKVASNHPAVVLEAARRLRDLHAPALLIDLLARSGFARCGSCPMLVEMAGIASSLGIPSLALELVDAAILVSPKDPHARYVRGTQLLFAGRLEEAEADLETSIRLGPDAPQPHWVLSRLRKWSLDNNHVVRIRKVLREVRRDSEAEVILLNALHNELHDMGRFDESWSALERSCAIKRKLRPYEPAGDQALFEEIKRQCTAEFVMAQRERQDAYTPVFIVGMHRSGTTLLERILAGHSLVASGGESYSFSAPLKVATDHLFAGTIDITAARRLGDVDFDRVGRDFIEDSLWRSQGRPFLVEKLPANFIIAGLIAKAIPGAKILHMMRDPVDTCFSNLRTYFTNTALYSFDQIQLANYFAQYQDLMRHWHSEMPGRILDVSYRDLVSDPEPTVRRVFDFCGLPFEKEAMEVGRKSGVVMTASAPEVRRGIMGDRSVAWAPYRPSLAPLFARLEEVGVL